MAAKRARPEQDRICNLMPTPESSTKTDWQVSCARRWATPSKCACPKTPPAVYRWIFDGPLELTQTRSNYPRDAVGSAGEAVFAVRARAAGTTRLRLTCGRPWEGDGGVRKTFNIVVHVLASGETRPNQG